MSFAVHEIPPIYCCDFDLVDFGCNTIATSPAQNRWRLPEHPLPVNHRCNSPCPQPRPTLTAKIPDQPPDLYRKNTLNEPWSIPFSVLSRQQRWTIKNTCSPATENRCQYFLFIILLLETSTLSSAVQPLAMSLKLCVTDRISVAFSESIIVYSFVLYNIHKWMSNTFWLNYTTLRCYFFLPHLPIPIHPNKGLTIFNNALSSPWWNSAIPLRHNFADVINWLGTAVRQLLLTQWKDSEENHANAPSAVQPKSF